VRLPGVRCSLAGRGGAACGLCAGTAGAAALVAAEGGGADGVLAGGVAETALAVAGVVGGCSLVGIVGGGSVVGEAGGAVGVAPAVAFVDSSLELARCASSFLRSNISTGIVTRTPRATSAAARANARATREPERVSRLGCVLSALPRAVVDSSTFSGRAPGDSRVASSGSGPGGGAALGAVTLAGVPLLPAASRDGALGAEPGTTAVDGIKSASRCVGAMATGAAGSRGPRATRAESSCASSVAL
jgi:hypothetical protein